MKRRRKNLTLLHLIYVIYFLHSSFADIQHCNKEKGCETEPSGKPQVLKKGNKNNEDLSKDEVKNNQIPFEDEEKATNPFTDINNLPPLDNALYVIPEHKHPQVIWWYPDIYPHQSQNEIKCSLGTCTVTNDQKELTNPLTRGLIFYGTSFYAQYLPLPRLPHHEWCLLHEESPKNQWMFSDDIGIRLFNHTSTFRRESDYPISTQYIRDPGEWFEDTFIVTTSEKNRLQKDEGLASTVFVQRDCNPPSDRDTYITELMKYMKIDSYGRCLNNKEMPKDIDGFHKLSSKPYYHFLAKYKFQISFENAVCQDYMTEKVFRPLQIGSVPIYFGSSKIRDFMPSDKAVIVATDFKSPKDLADYLKELNEDDNKYNEYLKHRKVGKVVNPEFDKALQRQQWKLPHISHKVNFGHIMFSGYSCYVCDQLHKRNNMLKDHLRDSSKPIKPLKMANSSHMGCPKPQPILPISKKRTYRVFDYGRPEAEALTQMLLANETDSANWGNYLLIKTDKYPKPLSNTGV